MAHNDKLLGQEVITDASPSSDSDLERIGNEKAAEAGQFQDASNEEHIDPAVERRLVWKTDLLLMPALGNSTPSFL